MTYQQKKSATREKAVFWQLEYGENAKSYEELMNDQEYFEKAARRYGLIREFRENGII